MTRSEANVLFTGRRASHRPRRDRGVPDRTSRAGCRSSPRPRSWRSPSSCRSTAPCNLNLEGVARDSRLREHEFADALEVVVGAVEGREVRLARATAVVGCPVVRQIAARPVVIVVVVDAADIAELVGHRRREDVLDSLPTVQSPNRRRRSPIRRPAGSVASVPEVTWSCVTAGPK